MWAWAPTSNSVYGNFPANRKPSSTSVPSGLNQQQPQMQQTFYQAAPPPSVQQPGFFGGSNHATSNASVYQMSLPADSFLPSSKQYNNSNNNCYQEQQGSINPQGVTANAYGNDNGNYCQMFPPGTFPNNTCNFQHSQPQVEHNSRAAASNRGNDNNNQSYNNYPQAPVQQNLSAGDSNNNNNEATVEYLYGEEAEKVLRQLQVSQQPYQPMSTQAATTGVAPTMSTNMENGSGERAHASNGDTSKEQTHSDISHSQNNYYSNQPENPIQPQTQQISTPYFEVSQQPTNSNKKKGKTVTPAEDDFNNRYFYTYETPPLVSPQPEEAVPPRVQSSNTEQRAATAQGRRLASNKPTFHLCGRCTKCKMIQGESTKSPAPNAYTLPKPPLGPTQSIKNGPMGRQMSATVFHH